MNESKIIEIEKFLNENKQFIQKLKCCHSEFYKQMNTFTFLPGHRSTILAIPEKLNSNKSHAHKCMHSNEELKQSLINKLMTCSGKAGFQFPEGIISEANIKNYERVDEGDLVCRCKFTCPFCPKSYSLIFKKYWMSSNATKHLKLHIAGQNKETNP